jgi:hypothetical protein
VGEVKSCENILIFSQPLVLSLYRIGRGPNPCTALALSCVVIRSVARRQVLRRRRNGSRDRHQFYVVSIDKEVSS